MSWTCRYTSFRMSYMTLCPTSDMKYPWAMAIRLVTACNTKNAAARTKNVRRLMSMDVNHTRPRYAVADFRGAVRGILFLVDMLAVVPSPGGVADVIFSAVFSSSIATPSICEGSTDTSAPSMDSISTNSTVDQYGTA